MTCHNNKKTHQLDLIKSLLFKENNKEITMVLSIDNDGKRKRIPQYTMAAQSVSPEYSAINSGNISPCFREANPNTIIAEVIAK